MASTMLELRAVSRLERDLVAAVNRLNCGVLARDADGVILFVSERARKWLDYTEEEIVGQPVEKLIPPELDELILKEMKAVEGGDARARITYFQRKDSTTFPVLLIPQNRTPEDRDEPYFVVVVDLGTVQTAKPATYSPAARVAPNLERIALELQIIGLTADTRGAPPVPLEHPDLKELTRREREVLIRLMAGERVPAIAKHLHISPHTVRNHLKSIYRKLGVGNQSELIERVGALRATRN